MPPRPVKKPVVTTKNSEKVIRKQASSSTLIVPTPLHQKKLKINLSKHPGKDKDIIQKEEVLAIENKMRVQK